MARKSMKASATNLWDKVEFYCGNHKEPIEMVLREGNSPFFACPKYMLKDEKHPDGHEENERACLNRMSFDDAGDIIMKLNEVMAAESLDIGETIDFTGFVFKWKSYTVTIMKYNSYTGKLKLKIINRKALMQ